MNKLKLNLSNVKEVLTREQLKQIIGGSGSGISAKSCQRYCFVELNGNQWVYGDSNGGDCVTTDDCPAVNIEDCGTQYREVVGTTWECATTWGL